MKKKKNYSKLYIDILKLGMSSVHTGIAFVQLEDKLVKKGYDFRNDCIELAVKQWFSSNIEPDASSNYNIKCIPRIQMIKNLAFDI